MKCKSSSTGIHRRSYGSRLSSLFLSVLWSFSAYSLSAQIPQEQKPYSEMTRAELLMQIEQKDKLIAEWVKRGEQWKEDKKQLQTLSDNQTNTIKDLTTSLKDQKQASDRQLESRDKVIADQEAVIADYEAKESLAWIEKILWTLGGAGIGYFVGGLGR